MVLMFAALHKDCVSIIGVYFIKIKLQVLAQCTTHKIIAHYIKVYEWKKKKNFPRNDEAVLNERRVILRYHETMP